MPCEKCDDTGFIISGNGHEMYCNLCLRNAETTIHWTVSKKPIAVKHYRREVPKEFSLTDDEIYDL